MNDIQIAIKYLRKARSSEDRGVAFNLSFTSYKNLMRSKKCFYTDIRLTTATSTPPLPADRTIDRIDFTKGYVKGNVVACCHAANQFKNDYFESTESILDQDGIVSIIQKMNKINK